MPPHSRVHTIRVRGTEKCRADAWNTVALACQYQCVNVAYDLKQKVLRGMRRPVWRGGSSTHLWTVHVWTEIECRCVGSEFQTIGAAGQLAESGPSPRNQHVTAFSRTGVCRPRAVSNQHTACMTLAKITRNKYDVYANWTKVVRTRTLRWGEGVPASVRCYESKPQRGRLESADDMTALPPWNRPAAVVALALLAVCDCDAALQSISRISVRSSLHFTSLLPCTMKPFKCSLKRTNLSPYLKYFN